jgi:ribosomal protein S18 acetylase RimI-like enzyme
VSSGSPPSGEPALADAQRPRIEIRTAAHGDVAALVAGVAELLLEIGGKAASSEQLEEAAHALIDDPDGGLVLIAACAGEIVGVLGASWQSAIRIPGRYALIQELWVAASHRHLQIGTQLLDELALAAARRRIVRLEVGLPNERFPALADTEAFYAANDFTPVGTRMRRLLR